MGGNGWANAPTYGSVTPQVYSHQYFIGNGVQINWGTQTDGTTGPTSTSSNGFYILIPGQSSYPAYTGAGGNDYVIEGVVSTGKIISFVRFQTDNYNSLLSTQQITQGVHVRNITATYQADANMTTGSAFLIQGGDGGEVRDITVDMSACSVGNNDCLNVTGSFGECRNWTFERLQLIGNGGNFSTPAMTYITPIELQGNVKTGTATGGTHDLTFIDCTFDSGVWTIGGTQTLTMAQQFADGLLLDDSNGQATIAGWIYNVTFLDCHFLVCPLQLNPTTTGNGDGYNIVGGAGTTPYAFTNSATTADSNSVTRAWAGFFPMSVQVSNGTATVTAVTINGNATGGTTGSYILMPGDVISVAYSGGASVWPVIDVVPYGYFRFLGGTPPVALKESSVTGMTGRGCGAPYGLIGLAASPSSYTNLSGGIESVIIGGTVTGITGVTLNGTTIASSTTVPLKVDLNYGDTLVITWSVTQPKVYKQLK